MINCIKYSVIYHLQKKYKKRFFVKNKKYLVYLVFIGIFCTLSYDLIAISSSSQESTITPATKPQKKDKVDKSASLSTRKSGKQGKEQAHTTQADGQPDKTALPDTNSKENTSEQTLDQTTTPEIICSTPNVPVEYLTAQELEQALACAEQQQALAKQQQALVEQQQALADQKKAKADQEVEKLAQILEKAEQEEAINPTAAIVKIEQRKKYLLNYITDAPRCPYSNVPLKKLKAEQLAEVYAYTQTHKMDGAFMIDLLERLIALSDNHAGVKQYKLQLADKHYELHHIEKAAACYEDFAVLYPGSKEHEYVLYKAVACMFELSLDSDRDQTNTKKTITLIKEFLKHAKNFDLTQEAKAMLQKCYDRLFGHEVYVFNFYSKKKNFVAAQMRLDYIAKNFTETIADLDAKVEELTAQLALRKNPVKPTKKSLINRYLA